MYPQHATTDSGIYLLHLDSPLGNERHQAQHYVGWARNIQLRLKTHAAGRGSHFTRAAVERGIGWRVARVWCGADRTAERRVKASGRSFADFCPVCSGHAAMRRLAQLGAAAVPAAPSGRSGLIHDGVDAFSAIPAPQRAARCDWYQATYFRHTAPLTDAERAARAAALEAIDDML